MTTPGQRVNFLPLTLFDNLHGSRVLIHNILKRKYNPIIQGRLRVLRKTTHKDCHRHHFVQLSRCIANTHIRKTRRNTTLRHHTTTNLRRLSMEKESISWSVGNIHSIFASLDCFSHQIKSKPARQSTANKVDFFQKIMKLCFL